MNNFYLRILFAKRSSNGLRIKEHGNAKGGLGLANSSESPERSKRVLDKKVH
jgi:hypothetical protein